MANMPGVGLEIFKAGGEWRDQKWAPPWSVKLPSLRRGRMQTLPCSLGRCVESLVFPLLPGEEIVRFACPTEWGSAIFLALWAGRAHAFRPWSGKSLGFPR
ncbi:hypothetical protein T4C_11938 [Trichinella pseudospiralis]|uniref:Uncharacterized protein n=1 Tax=Trichinella pseudospiralis TaxID=6337 RepID=A0A0V1JJK9_TRIPS|nr:hypothetical protein T4C_11938 [Trichinella pseudospiralis]